MEGSTKQPAVGERPADTGASSGFQSRFIGLAFQLSLVWLLLASLWQLIGPEPRSTFEHRLQMAVVGLAQCLTAGLWIVSSKLPNMIKTISVGGCLLVTLLIEVNSAWEFNACRRVLEPARIRQGRIVHEGLGLSYATLPNWNVNLQPTIENSQVEPAKSGSKSHSRLRFGEKAVFRYSLAEPQSSKTDRLPTRIMLTIQRVKLYDFNALFASVRSNEAKFAVLPGARLVQHTHQLQIDGLGMVELEYVQEPQHLITRNVYLRTDLFVLTFTFITENDGNRALFDEFLNSIRLDSSVLFPRLTANEQR